MGNTQNKILRNVSFSVLVLLLVVVTAVAFMTYRADPESHGSFAFAVEHHVEIMGALVLIAISFGFVTSKVLYAELQKERRESKNILAIVLLFLNHEERAIINLLVESSGRSTQAEVARLPHMTRVKAHRSLQKMQEKQLVEIVAHGKVRKVFLRQNILELLQEQR